ncbi:MAG: 2OG-Fe(II) oxygenase [Acidimicrobiaceae bacterium]|nr:2OG-Fe(II) oxygenase [Acidimicrobiaceae bacterium]
MTTLHIDSQSHPISDPDYATACKEELDAAGALVLPNFFTPEAIDAIIRESANREDEAFYAASTHNVYLTPTDASFAPDHAFNRQVASSKGLLADDQVPADSPLRDVYNDETFRAFLSEVLGIDSIYPYADAVSSINVHFAAQGRELGWHFDNSSFAVTMLLQAPEAGGVFEYVPSVRNADSGEQGYRRVAAILDREEPVQVLQFEPGALVMFRGRDAIHRVTPTEGGTTRMLVVFAFNDAPGVTLSHSALETFYGRVR